MAIPANTNRAELHGVVLVAKFRGGQKTSQNLRVSLSGPPREQVEKQEHQQSTDEAGQEIECGRSHAHGKEEKLSLGSENRKRP
jgi:hypothetical protein